MPTRAAPAPTSAPGSRSISAAFGRGVMGILLAAVAMTWTTLVANTEAHIQNKRFVDTDLNRQFTYEALQQQSSTSVEAQRAKEINQLLGPKNFDDDGDSSSSEQEQQQQQQKADSDVIIDLHTTTTNMGITLIVGEGNKVMTQCAAYIRAKLNIVDSEVNILMHTHKRQKDRPHLSSIAKCPLSIEVGPVPQGVLRHDMVEKTQSALELAFEFLDKSCCTVVNDDEKAAKEELQKVLKEYYPGGKVPCYRSAPSQREGEMSSKIPWPCDPDNENFPAWMVHKDLQDQDFCELAVGDPLFVDLDGNVIAYDGSHGSPVRVMFVNEGGYYYASSGTGISVARLDHFNLESGEIV
ncbi:MAG: hypothetical protein SGBAC_008318 [Bacillariaceae sp.]